MVAVTVARIIRALMGVAISEATSSTAVPGGPAGRTPAGPVVAQVAPLPRSSPPHWAARAAISACAAGGAVFALSATAGGAVRVVLALLLLVGTPTTRDLAPRLATNLILAVGWLPVLMWVPAGLLGGRTSWLLGLVAALVVAARTRPGSMLRLRPLASRRHLALLAAPAAAGLSAWPLFADRPSERVLAGLMRGWDHAGHYSMYFDQRGVQAPPPWGLAPDGSRWDFASYPQWVHTLMAELAELRWGSGSGPALEELTRYAHLNGVLFVVVATLLAATVLTVAAPAGGGIAAALAVAVPIGLLSAPGARMVLLGYTTFLVITVAVVCMIALVCAARKRSWTITWVLSAGVVTSSAWLLLLPLTGVVAAVHTAARLASGTRRERILVLAVAVVTGVPVAMALVAARAAKSQTALNFGGEVTRLRPAVVIALLVLVVLTSALALRVRRGGSRSRHAAVTAVALTALVELGVLGYHQLQTIGRLEYYWWKLASAMTILGVVLLTLELALPHRSRSPRLGDRAGVILWCMTIGLLGPGIADRDLPAPTPVTLLSLSPGLTDTGRLPQARALVSVAERPPCGQDVFRTIVLLPSSHDRTGQSTDQWFHALHHGRSGDVAAQEQLLIEFQDQPGALTATLSSQGWALWAPDLNGPEGAPSTDRDACRAEATADR